MKVRLLPHHLVPALIAALGCASSTLPTTALAKQGATDPIPGTSNGATNSGGSSGGGNSKKASSPSTPAPAPAPAPVTQPLVNAPLTFVPASAASGASAVCAGSYRIDPYYPTLSLMTVSLQTSSVEVPDGTPLYVTINLASGTGYPFNSNVLVISGQAGACSVTEYLTPGSTIASVVVKDGAGQVLFTGQ